MSTPRKPRAMSATSAMDGKTRQLAGNAAADLLAEVFACELASAQTACAGCGRTELHALFRSKRARF